MVCPHRSTNQGKCIHARLRSIRRGGRSFGVRIAAIRRRPLDPSRCYTFTFGCVSGSVTSKSPDDGLSRIHAYTYFKRFHVLWIDRGNSPHSDRVASASFAMAFVHIVSVPTLCHRDNCFNLTLGQSPEPGRSEIKSATFPKLSSPNNCNASPDCPVLFWNVHPFPAGCPCETTKPPQLMQPTQGGSKQTGPLAHPSGSLHFYAKRTSSNPASDIATRGYSVHVLA